MKVSIDAFGLTDRGRVRESNQDNFLIVDISKSVDVRHSSLSKESIAGRFGSASGQLFVVADGVGGGPSGDRASEATIRALLRYVGETVGCFNATSTTKEQEMFTRLEDTVRDVHLALLEESEGSGQGPATTLTMVLLIWPRAYLIHTGDSRAYVRRRGQVQQLSTDQTFGEYMVTLGAWTKDQAASSRPGATLTSAVGGPDFQPIVGLVDLEPGDSMLLCSDGLSKHVDDERIAAVLGNGTSSEAMSRVLLDEALAAGGTDNITVVVVQTA
jgi:serine/threonine protein phosphatase PrpC